MYAVASLFGLRKWRRHSDRFAVAFPIVTVRKQSHGLRSGPNRLLLNPLQLSTRESSYIQRHNSEVLNASRMHQDEILMKEIVPKARDAVYVTLTLLLLRDVHTFSDRLTFNHSVVCLTTGPKPLPKRALHIVRSRASSLKWEYPFLSLRSSSSFLRLLPRLPLTSIPLLPFL